MVDVDNTLTGKSKKKKKNWLAILLEFRFYFIKIFYDQPYLAIKIMMIIIIFYNIKVKKINLITIIIYIHNGNKN